MNSESPPLSIAIAAGVFALVSGLCSGVKFCVSAPVVGLME